MSYDAERRKKPQVTDVFERQTELCVLGLNGTLLSLQGGGGLHEKLTAHSTNSQSSWQYGREREGGRSSSCHSAD